MDKTPTINTFRVDYRGLGGNGEMVWHTTAVYFKVNDALRKAKSIWNAKGHRLTRVVALPQEKVIWQPIER